MDIVNNLKNTASYIGLGIAAAIAGCIAPVVSLVALPIFAVKAAIVEIQLRKSPMKSEELHGRISGQDYSRWDGKLINTLQKVQKYSEKSFTRHFHGFDDYSFMESETPVESAFKDLEDLKWLKRELVVLERNDLIGDIRFHAKFLIPIIGFTWAICSDISVETVVLKFSRARAWSNKEALDFHIENLSKKLNVPNQ